MKRALFLKRTVLAELTTEELGEVGGGANSFSCLDYVSCYPTDCVPTFRDCCTG